MLPPRAPGFVRSCARRATAGLLAVVQLVVLLASLTEPRGGASGLLRPGAGAQSAREVNASAALGEQGPRHDEATCPACIVRSLHARLEVQVPLPNALVRLADRVVPKLAFLPPTTPSFSNLSRAPPFVG